MFKVFARAGGSPIFCYVLAIPTGLREAPVSEETPQCVVNRFRFQGTNQGQFHYGRAPALYAAPGRRGSVKLFGQGFGGFTFGREETLHLALVTGQQRAVRFYHHHKASRQAAYACSIGPARQVAQSRFGIRDGGARLFQL